MHKSVIDIFPSFSVKFEGRVNHMYLDVKGLVTTGVGNLIDPLNGSKALKLPWLRKVDNQPASEQEIRDEWYYLKTRPDLARKHYKYAGNVCKLYLSEEAIDQLVFKKLEDNEKILKKYYPQWDSYPADAQLGILSMAWAVGAGFPEIFKNFTQYALRQEWDKAADCCGIKTTNNPGVVPRNAANKRCFRNANITKNLNPGFTMIFWPDDAEGVIVAKQDQSTFVDPVEHHLKNVVAPNIAEELREITDVAYEDEGEA